MKLIISGATKGIGRAIAEKFAENRFDIAFCGRNQLEVEEFQKYLISKFGINAFGFALDISEKQNAIAFGAQALSALGGCDVLINNAGVFLPGSIQEEEEGVFEYQMAINLNSAYYLTKVLLKSIKSGLRPHIFNMCSIASLKAYPDGSSYCISKFALLGFTKVLREELKPFAVGVTAVMPGATITESWGNTDMPLSRFILPKNIAESIWTAWNVNENAVLEEILIRPIQGDI